MNKRNDSIHLKKSDQTSVIFSTPTYALSFRGIMVIIVTVRK